VVAFKTFTNTKSHITILTLYLYSPLYSLCGADTAVQSGGLNWPVIAEVYRKPSSLFLQTHWSACGLMWTM
jgi:hypothetical protein